MDFLSVADIFRAYKATSVDQRVAPDDVMYNTGPSWYFGVGASGLTMVLHALSMSWLHKVNRVLDLPCGHGRVGRHLKAAFPAAEFFFCDLDPAGVDFCSTTFGGQGIYSKPDLSDVDLPNDLDVIWVGSLFTHLDAERSRRWIAKLASHLSPHGVLVLTLHGPSTLAIHNYNPLMDPEPWSTVLDGYKKTGYGYAPYPSKMIDGGMLDYGVSLSHPSKIMEWAVDLPGVRTLAYSERAWANNHDVLMLTRNDRYTPV